MSRSSPGPDRGLPLHAWRWPMGAVPEQVSVPRVTLPMIDDGPWGGVPLGGLGAGSVGRTHRGDFARWHLDVGRHQFQSVPANQFSVFVERGGERSAHVLTTIRPEALRSWNWDMPVGAGTYHARFPAAWFEYDWDALPVRLIQKQWSPVIPGNYRESSYPVGLFEWTIENPGSEPVKVGVMFSWQNLVGFGHGQERRGGHRNRAVRRDGLAGVIFEGPPDEAGESWAGTFAIVAREENGVALSTCERFSVDDGADLWADFAADGRLDDLADTRPAEPGEGIGAAVAATVELQPGETGRVTFALAWDIPIAEFGAGTRWYKRYTRFFGRSGGSAWQIAATALECAETWAAEIDAWQAPILADPHRPDWYKTALFNELYYLVDGGTIWADGRVGEGPGAELATDAAIGVEPAASAALKVDLLVPDLATSAVDVSTADEEVGRFAVLECYDYPFYNTLDVNFYASFALLQLWPALERQVIADFVASVAVSDPEIVTIQWSGRDAARKIAGALPHDVGGPPDDPFLRLNYYRFQDINIWKDLNSKFVLQLWRDARVLGDDLLLAEAWPAVISALDYLAAFDRDGDGLPEHDGEPDQTYDTWPMRGPSAYGGALWLAALRAAIAIGTKLGDAANVGRFEDLLARGSAAFDAQLWNGRYYRYDTSGGPSSETVMADQLAGQWYADATGLGDLVSPDRVESALRTIFELNVKAFGGGEMGAVNGMRPNGTVDESSEQSPEVWIGTTYALAAFMLGRGLVEEAWQTARGAAAVTYSRGLWFRTPEAYDRAGNYRASLYLRPLAIWAIEHALANRPRAAG